MQIRVSGAIMIVVPSAAAARSASAAAWPPLPGLLSTTTFMRIEAFSLSATSRAIASAGLPAGAPTRIVRVVPCARAGPAASRSIARKGRISVLPIVLECPERVKVAHTLAANPDRGEEIR
jgi:hypothetical protein